MAHSILTFEPCGTHTFKCVADNGVCIGELYPEVDGFYVYEPDRSRGGCFSEQILMELALKLSELNADWNDMIHKDLASRPMELVSTIDDLQGDDPFTNSRTGALL